MAAPFLAWSFSRLKMFKECPRQIWHSAVAPKGHVDRIEFEQSKQMLDGIEVDNALTSRIAKGTPLPSKFAPFEPMCQVVLATPGTKFTQMQLALDETFKPCGYKDWNTAWVRVVFDLAIINGPHAFILDWKNGNFWLDEDQLRLFATVAFHTFPELEEADTNYVWLKTGVLSPAKYSRRELPDLWATFLPDVERLQSSYKANHWPAAPARGEKSCAYCAVNRAGKCKEAQGKYKG